MQANESDNEFAVRFAEAANPLHRSTRTIIYPKELDLGDDIKEVIRTLKEKTFNHPCEKTFADVRDLLEREMNKHNVSQIIDKHNELLGDVWAEQKLKNAPHYCGCQVFFRSKSLYENIIQNSPDESLFEHLLKQTNVYDKYLNHLIYMPERSHRVNLHSQLIAIFKKSEEARRAMEMRVREVTPAWLEVKSMYNILNEMCKTSLRKKEFDAFVFAHYLMLIENGDGSCSCDTILQDMRLDNVDQRDRSLMYYLLADFGRFRERPRIRLIKHILIKLQQPTALRITKTVYLSHNRSKYSETIDKFLDSSYTGKQHQRLKEIFDKATEKINSEEIKKTCFAALREHNFVKFVDFHCQVTMDIFPCPFCGEGILNMWESTNAKTILEQMRKSNPSITNDSISHIFRKFGFQEHSRTNFMILGNGRDEIICLNRNPEIIHPKTDEYQIVLEDILAGDEVDHVHHS